MLFFHSCFNSYTQACISTVNSITMTWSTCTEIDFVEQTRLHVDVLTPVNQ